MAVHSIAPAAPACAQGPAEPAAEPAGGLDGILVPPQHRGENRQDATIATATATAQVARSGVRSPDELLAVPPGLQMDRQRRAGLPFIPGIGVVSAPTGDESPVATYVDRVHIPSLQNEIVSFNTIRGDRYAPAAPRSCGLAFDFRV